MNPVILPAWSEVATETGSVHRLLAGFSGGLDSTVLLHLARQWSAQSGLPLLAIHVNHQLSPHAADWQSHCHSVCALWNIPFHAATVSVLNTGHGLEAAARNARYEVYTQVAREGDLLLLGHHQDDQAETVLQRLLRGSGVLGLRGMERYAAFRHFHLYRPLLNCSRAQLQAFALAQRESERLQDPSTEGLAPSCQPWHWIEDESNTSERFDRNFLRHQILPLLQARWPQAMQSIERSSQHCAEAQQLLDERAREDLLPRLCEDGGLVCVEGAQSSASPVSGISAATMSAGRLRNMLRYWLRQYQVPLPSEVQLEQIVSHLIPAPGDAVPVVQWGGIEIRRYRQRLYVIPSLPPPQAFVWTLFRDHSNEHCGADCTGQVRAGPDPRDTSLMPPDLAPLITTPLTLPSGGSLRVRAQRGGQALRLDRIDTRCVGVRFRQGGETCKLAGRPTRPLKKILQESALPPWWRERLPLIYVGEVPAVIPGVGVCEGFQVLPDEWGLAFDWLPPSIRQIPCDPSGKP